MLRRYGESDTGYGQMKRRASMWLGISIFLLFLCALLLLYTFAMKRGIREIKEELSLTRKRSYNRQLQVTLFDNELTGLAAEINHNLDYQKELKLRAEQSEIKLKQSISDIAHDLRTPLTVIKGNLQMMDRNDTIVEEDKVYLGICQEKADILKNMVDNFFEMSVLESDNTQIELRDTDMTALLAQFVIDHEAVIREYGLIPDIKLPEKSIIVPVDEKLLLRMLGNLLNNVVKYAKESFRLSMEIVETERIAMCQIAFSNKMPVDSDLDVEHLFDRTYRGNQARRGPGAGLGLYIVKLLADRQEAEVFAKQEMDELIIGIRYPLKS